jgi:hypothetical protein
VVGDEALVGGDRHRPAARAQVDHLLRGFDHDPVLGEGLPGDAH